MGLEEKKLSCERVELCGIPNTSRLARCCIKTVVEKWCWSQIPGFVICCDGCRGLTVVSVRRDASCGISLFVEARKFMMLVLPGGAHLD